MNRIFGIRIGKGITAIRLLVAFPVIFLMVSCNGEKKDNAREMLEILLQEDLKGVVKGIPDSVLLEKPYYKVVSFKESDTGVFQKNAVVDFYYMKKLPVKLVTKYRYHIGSRIWDRYNNAYIAIKDSSNTSGMVPRNDSAGVSDDSSNAKVKIDTSKRISDSKIQTVGALKTPLVISKSAIPVNNTEDTASSKGK